MKIEDGEIIFEKHWNQWTEEEREEFISVMKPEDMRFPLYLNWAMEYYHLLNTEARSHLVSLGFVSKGQN